MRVLNLGGVGNADVLLVPRSGAAPAVVKDYGRRPALVRRWLVPLLVGHELRMLERLEGLPGLPRPLGRVGKAALAIEYLEGTELRRRALPGGLPPAFFDALEGIVDGISQRGIAYLDLRSSRNVLCTPSLAPALIDLASAYPLPLPRWFRDWYYREALAKLRRRFLLGDPSWGIDPPQDRDLKFGGIRFRLVDEGRGDDPVPTLLLHDAGLAARSLAPLSDRAAAHGRRAIAPDLPGFGASARPRRSVGPGGCAARLLPMLDGLSLARVDLVGHRWGGLVARELAIRAPDRVRALVTLDTPLRLEGELATRWKLARSDAEQLRARVDAELPEPLDAASKAALRYWLARISARTLARAYLEIPPPPWPVPHQPWGRVDAADGSLASDSGGLPATARRLELSDALREPDRLWQELAALSGERSAAVEAGVSSD